ncbi:MAG: hypothetical protein GEU96_08685 [Propionibacteriales bacterium]|nr:hypothetical protein [Propionibacteriales bacterium]
MIIRIMAEGQWELADDQVDGLNALDSAVEKAVEGGEEAVFRTALDDLLASVRAQGTEVPVDTLVDSDLILPPSDATIDDVRALLSDEGLIPG